ncbi:MAG: hypothetical protein MI976_19495 [Pseudomonadales bacterium]|nr:hypothetical protein [Pseudomonadales bacterium]
MQTFKGLLLKPIKVILCLILLATAPMAFAVTVLPGSNSGGYSSVLVESASLANWDGGSVLAPPAIVEGEVIYESVEFVNGVEDSIVNLNGLAEGTYQLTLTDFVFPAALESLAATVVSATDVVDMLFFSEGATEQQLIFEINEVDSYYLAIYGAASGAYNLGLYGVELRNVSLSAVPLPLPALLLLVGLGVLVSIKRSMI